MGKEAAVVLKNFAGDAAGYFAATRLPASLIAGTSLGALFVFARSPSGKWSNMEGLLIKTYQTLMVTSFILSFSTVIICTSATVSMLHGRFDPMADTAYNMLRREFDYEFTVTRWCFLVSLLCFIMGLTNRVVLEYDLIRRGECKNHALAVVFVFLALVSHLLSHINQSLFCWDNLFSMTIDVVKMIVAGAKTNGTTKPLEVVALACFFISLYFLIKSIFDNNDKDQQEEEDKKRKKE